MPENEKLENEGLLMIILSGANEEASETRRYRKLRYRLKDVLYDEEHPKPIEKDGKKVKVEPNLLIKGRYFTTGTSSKVFDDAFLDLVLRGCVESVGHGGDYLVYRNELNHWAEKAKIDSGISETEYNYLRNVGKKLNQPRSR